MLSELLTETFIQIINLKYINRVVIISPYLLLLYRYTVPTKYRHLESIMTLRPSHIEILKPMICAIFGILVHINFMIIQGIIVLIIGLLIQWCKVGVGRLLEIDTINKNRRRDIWIKSFFTAYIYIGILIYDIAIYSDMLLEISLLMDIVYKRPVFWVSKFPFILVGVSIVASLFISTDQT